MKHFMLQPEYAGSRKIKVTVSNVPVALLGHVLVSFFSKFRHVEDFNAVQGAVSAIGVFSFLMSKVRRV